MRLQHFFERAEELDSRDSLGSFRSRFYKTDDTMIYLDGNSLGRMPVKTPQLIREAVEHQWGDRLIRSWNEHWMALPGRIAGKLAELLGAESDEICVGDSTSVNLYKLAFSALACQKGRTKIVTDSMNFPTDLYILQGLADQQFSNHSIHVVESKDGITMDSEDIINALDENTALLTLSHVTYKSAWMYNMKFINEKAREKGVLVIWDLSHAAGAVPVRLNEWGTDMAVGCTYKYLNGGPGSPAYLYVNKRLFERVQSPVWGWFGHQAPFEFSSDYVPDSAAAKFSAGTPGILSLIPVEAGLDVLLEAGIETIREKSIKQTGFLIEMAESVLRDSGYSVGSPKDEIDRGSHVSLTHQDGYRISQALIKPEGDAPVIIPDFRPPDNIRLGITPLYTSFTDLVSTVQRLSDIVSSGEFKNFSADPEGVT